MKQNHFLSFRNILSGLFIVLSALSLLDAASGFDLSRSDNLVLYWGQDSYGATHNDVANFQQRLGFYCGSDSVTDTFPMAFLTVAFGEDNLPSIDLSNTCNENDNATFPGTELVNCSSLAGDIEKCQAAGKIVTISIGGATGGVSFTSDSQGQTFANTIWNVFLGGSSSTRPFGSAVLDGVDLDIEGGGSTGYAAFVTQLRSLAATANKQYYITAAPQCPFPDANLGSVINAVGFDAVYVQFYNNFCGLQAFSNPNDWNFATWDNWAHTMSPNSNVKVYIGAPASSTAAGSGYVDAATLANIIKTTKATYTSFGGVMMWDASQAYANSRYDVAAKNALTEGTTSPAPPPSSSSTKPTSTTSTSSSSSAAPTSNCAGVPLWSSSIAYDGGSEVTFNGHLWTAKWWSEADTPGGAAGDWQDDGACTAARIIRALKQDGALKSRSMWMLGLGSVHFQPVINGKPGHLLEFERVLHVPDLRNNLLSVLYLTHAKSYIVTIQHDQIFFKHNGALLFTAAINSNNAASINGQVVPMTQFSGMVSTCPLDLTLWHQHFAHLNHGNVKKLIQEDLVKGIVVKSKDLPDPICKPCIAGKQHRLNVSKLASHHASGLLELVHSDVHGPLPVQTRHGYHYWITFIDDHSCHWAVMPLKKKSDAFAAFKHFKAYAENQLNLKIKATRDDKGGEYMPREWDQFCNSEGIHRQHTIRAEPHQNGVAERANWTLVEGITTMLNEAHLPATFWWDAVAAFVHVHNRSPTSAVQGKTPFELWHKSKPDVSHFRVFGCTSYVHVKKDLRRQLESHTQKCVFLGYPAHFKGWTFWNPITCKEVISDSAQFDERVFPGNSM
ncbi:hypothetical protein EW145_g4631 [Phellinidium pouzarii]|uniref:Uncharacterized protein n=1 Tax=Phellinidium pouzarii TaxID=167371 RepID=A0A4S4L7N8_9AGAM|nr:hypothetical protein EW145_g4631 [Phellinidium pouzarii]